MGTATAAKEAGDADMGCGEAPIVLRSRRTAAPGRRDASRAARGGRHDKRQGP